jgi:RNA polymerase sigma-70 factor (ECF subfamily)
MSLNGLNRQSRIKDDSIGDFEVLFKTYYVPLCRFAFSIVRDSDQAEEIVQEFFFNYWKNRKNIGIKFSIRAYMYKAVKNSALRYLAHRKVESSYGVTLGSTSGGFDNLDESSDELLKIVEATLQQLPERCRQAFILSRRDGLKYKEIAAKLSVSEKTVEADMTKALMALRQNLSRLGFNTH